MSNIPEAVILSPSEYTDSLQSISSMREVPYKIRFLVEAAPNLESKIATLQKFYDNVDFNERDKTYIVSNKGGEQFVLDDKQRTNLGDLIDISKEASEFIGSVAGAAGGTAINPGAGTVAGAGVGMSAANELFEQVGKIYGTEVLRSNKEHAAQRATDFAFGSVGQLAAPYIMKGFKYAVVGGKN